jgi:hypothetical protein
MSIVFYPTVERADCLGLAASLPVVASGSAVGALLFYTFAGTLATG